MISIEADEGVPVVPATLIPLVRLELRALEATADRDIKNQFLTAISKKWSRTFWDHVFARREAHALRTNGQPLNMKQIAQELNVSESAVSKRDELSVGMMLATMIQEGLSFRQLPDVPEFRSHAMTWYRWAVSDAYDRQQRLHHRSKRNPKSIEQIDVITFELLLWLHREPGWFEERFKGSKSNRDRQTSIANRVFAGALSRLTRSNDQSVINDLTHLPHSPQERVDWLNSIDKRWGSAWRMTVVAVNYYWSTHP